MSIRNAKPFRWSPVTVADTLDATNTIKGAMTGLVNLIPSPTTRNLWQCRPAAFSLANISTDTDFDATALVTCYAKVGNYVIGMASSAAFPGKDEPFIYNVLTNTFITITGRTNAGLPTSPLATGAWTPPSIAVVGVMVVITHPGYPGAPNPQFGTIDLTNLSTGTVPYVGAKITGATTLANGIIPSWVTQFNGRAYFGINPPTGQPSVLFSDVLNPTNTTNAGQALFFGDTEQLIVGAGLPLNNVLGGIIQSIMVFKTDTIYQITGDALSSSNPLTVNALDTGVGTQAPNSVAITPKGLSFLAVDGIRLVSLTGQVTDPIGNSGDGITDPISMPLVQTRVNCSCNGSTLRIAYQNSTKQGNPFEEYWYNFVRNVWSGPHTIAGMIGTAFNQTFIIAPHGQVGKIYESDAFQTTNSVYTEFGTTLSWTYQTAMLPDFETMSEMWLAETTVNVAGGLGSQMLTVLAADENGIIYDFTEIDITSTSSIWGQIVWGQFIWGSASSGLRPYKVQWPQPIVFRRISITVMGQSFQGLRVGDFLGKFAPLGYLQEQS